MTSEQVRALALASLVIVGCASEDPSLQRRGGPLPGSAGASGSSSQGGDGAGGGGALIPFCAALRVVRAKCQRCHTDPPANGAPVPFLTYDDFQRPYGDDGMFVYWQVAVGLVDRDVMPYVALNDPPTSLMPPVQPLTPGEKATLLGWLNQGATPEGGTDCP